MFGCQLILVGLLYLDFPLTHRNKTGYCKNWFFVLQIKWLAANYIPFSSYKRTCSISATSCWVLKSKSTPLMMDNLHFKAHKKLDGSTGLVKFFFTAMLRMIACNIDEKVLDSEGTLFQGLGTTLKISRICITCVSLIDETYRADWLCIWHWLVGLFKRWLRW